MTTLRPSPSGAAPRKLRRQIDRAVETEFDPQAASRNHSRDTPPSALRRSIRRERQAHPADPARILVPQRVEVGLRLELQAAWAMVISL